MITESQVFPMPEPLQMKSSTPINLIGVSGKAGSGKDEFAQILNLMAIDYNRTPYEVKKYAGKLKEIVKLMTGVTDWHMETQEGKKTHLEDWGMDIRKFQQLLGTEAIRNGLHSEAWVLALYSDFSALSTWVITDVRFPNEVEAIEKRGGLVVRVESDRPGVGAGNHPSEIALDDHHFNFTIENNGTLHEYQSKCKSFIQQEIFSYGV